MDKKLTQKQKKEIAEKKALRRRLLDILHGAHGDCTWDADPDIDEDFFLGMQGLDEIGRYLGAIKQLLIPEEKQWLIRFGKMENFSNIGKAVDYLYGIGIRA